MVSEVFCSAIYNWTGAVLVEGGEFWGGYASLSALQPEPKRRLEDQ